MANKKIAVIGIVGIPAQYGGFETFAEYLTKILNREFTFTVYCSSRGLRDRRATHNGARLAYIPLRATGIQSIPYDILSMLHSLFFADTLLVLGTSGCIALPLIRLFSKRRIVLNIAGLEWQRAKWSRFAQWFLKVSERIGIHNADVVVTDNIALQEYVMAEYGKRSVFIAYGGDQVKKLPLRDALTDKFPYLKDVYAFSVCRIQPDNNLDAIIEAFVKLKHVHLVIVGNWNYSDYGINLKMVYGHVSNIHLLDPIYDQDELNRLRGNCTLYIHGHSAGGTNPSLVEAMHLQLPILAFDVGYNRHTTENKAFYFTSADDIVHIVNGLTGERLQQCGRDMSEIADRLYRWEHVCRAYAGVL